MQGLTVGEEVLGFTDNNRASHGDLAVAAANQVTIKLASVGLDQAGALKVAGTTAYAAVRAVAPRAGETVVVSGAAGGVVALTVQLTRRAGARVIGIAGESNADWLRSMGVKPVTYGDGLAGQLRAVATSGIDAFIDTFGGGYVAVDLGVGPDRVETIIDFAAAEEVGASRPTSPEQPETHSPFGRLEPRIQTQPIGSKER